MVFRISKLFLIYIACPRFRSWDVSGEQRKRYHHFYRLIFCMEKIRISAFKNEKASFIDQSSPRKIRISPFRKYKHIVHWLPLATKKFKFPSTAARKFPIDEISFPENLNWHLLKLENAIRVGQLSPWKNSNTRSPKLKIPPIKKEKETILLPFLL